MSTEAPPGVRAGREGSRWINQRPTGEEVADWFKNNVPLAQELKGNADKYLTGVTLIPAKEKTNEVSGFRQDGAPIFVERHNLVYTPYIKVETRVAYFWDWMAAMDWRGLIEPVPVEHVEQDGVYNKHLPPGFFMFPVRANDGVHYSIGCSMRVRVFAGSTTDERPILESPTGTKIVPLLGRYGPDENSLMKAETGAVGRALGFAGVLVAPGSGIATAEDVQESMAHEPAAAVAETAQLPLADQTASEPESFRPRAEELLRLLEEQDPARFEQFKEWAQSRKFTSLGNLDEPQLKGVVRKLERELDEAEKAHEA